MRLISRETAAISMKDLARSSQYRAVGPPHIRLLMYWWPEA